MAGEEGFTGFETEINVKSGAVVKDAPKTSEGGTRKENIPEEQYIIKVVPVFN